MGQIPPSGRASWLHHPTTLREPPLTTTAVHPDSLGRILGPQPGPHQIPERLPLSPQHPDHHHSSLEVVQQPFDLAA
jgi:hypothetical protein